MASPWWHVVMWRKLLRQSLGGEHPMAEKYSTVPAITLSATPDPQARDAIARALLAHNATFLGPPESQFLAALLHSADGEVIGGLWGRTALRWLFVEILYVPETLRGQQIGTRLLQTAEIEARARGCLGAWLETFSPMARDFYLRQGYGTFGEIGEYPPGHARYFLCKRFEELR